MFKFGDKSEYMVADFETSNDPDACRVWLACITPLDMSDHQVFFDISDWFSYVKSNCVGKCIFFHNLAFDGTFIIDYLLSIGYDSVGLDSGTMKSRTFKSCISEMGSYYYIEIKPNSKDKIYIYDSYKLIPLSEADVCKTFGLDVAKGEIDYRTPRPKGYVPTADEISYVKNDCDIMCKALQTFRNEGFLDGFTIGMNAVKEFKKTISENDYARWFPHLTDGLDDWFRKAYKGGVCYVNPAYQGKTVGEGVVYDANSLYPSQMLNNPYPVGHPHVFNGYPPLGKLFIVHVRASFRVKPGWIPFIQMRSTPGFAPTEHVSETFGDESLDLYLTSVDFELFNRSYDIRNVEFLGGYWFDQANDLFKAYVEKFRTMKIEADREGNKGRRAIAKLFLNNLYGKFATNPHRRSKKPYLKEDGTTGYEMLAKGTSGKPIYTPIACFVTSYGRYETCMTAHLNWDRFLYCDTDSVHLLGKEEAKGIRIHDTEFGSWKLESEFVAGKYLHAKTYVEQQTDGSMNAHVCGCPRDLFRNITLDEFRIGYTTTGKLRKYRVKGGCLLMEAPFTIKDVKD